MTKQTMFTKTNSAAVLGLDCAPITVEVDLGKGFPQFNIVGLADTAIKEAKDRIRTMWRNSGMKFPGGHNILVNLAPADIKKEGSAFDLPIAAGIFLADNETEIDLRDALLIGELALDGALRHTNGILPLTIFAAENHYRRIFVPAVDAREAGLIAKLEVYPVENFLQFVRHLRTEKLIAPLPHEDAEKWLGHKETEMDMSYVKGQEFVKRALEIAASGAHNVLLSGPPGSGKTLLARTLPSILPRLTVDEAIEVTKIYSVAGLLPRHQPLVAERPFRAPHHSASGVALVGGGRIPKPGEISLAHRGVLFLDEFSEFPRTVLETLRQPLEDGLITISRAQGTLTFPARFTLIASQNPCPCGYATDPEKNCLCTPLQIANYRKKISGPLLDRIDLHVEVPRVKFEKLSQNESGENSARIRERVEEARERQNQRFRDLPLTSNAEMGGREIKEFCRPNDQTINLLKQAMAQLHLSARGYHRLLKLARTIADLAKSDDIQTEHVAEALQYRTKVE